MNKLDRTRLVFFAIIGLAVLIAGCGVAYSMITRLLEQAKATPTTVVLQSPGKTAQPADLTSPEPIYAPGYTAGKDNLPVYVCGADSFGSYFVLQQMQIAGKDVAHGFHLGIIPFGLDGNAKYDVSEEQRKALLNAGKWDCLLTTLESVSLSSVGVITAIVDESAGADQLWVRDVPTINDLKGKRIAFSRGSVGEYFVYYALSIARLNPRFDVTLVPADSVAAAVEAFNQGQADAVSGWEPDIYEAEKGGGVALLSSSQIRIVMDVIVTSRQAISGRTDAVQAFHDAWFDTLKLQLEDFDASAKQVAQWGHNDWSFVYADTASKDLESWLKTVAQADLSDNIFVMRDTTPIVTRLEVARRVWAATGAQVPNDNASDLVNPTFVANSAAQTALTTSATPINDSFSLTAKVEFSGLNPEDAVTLAVLPCRRFAFLPESTTLTLESRRILDECVLPTLSQSVGLYLQVKGSSAWPGPAGTYTEQEILEFAQARAQSVVDYLVSKGVDPARFIVQGTLPPQEHWETQDPELQAEDRYVEMILITVGR
jgi:ABC-type nitrate/sulfonate/bicarbonate transport system substrate-binding protein